MASVDALRAGLRSILASHVRNGRDSPTTVHSGTHSAGPAASKQRGHSPAPRGGMKRPFPGTAPRAGDRTQGKPHAGRGAPGAATAAVARARSPSHTTAGARAPSPARAAGVAAAPTPVWKKAGGAGKAAGGTQERAPRPAAASTVDAAAVMKYTAGAVASGHVGSSLAHWYEAPACALSLPQSPPTDATPGAKRFAAAQAAETERAMMLLRATAEQLLEKEVAAHESKRASGTSAETKWMRTVLTSGTARDKLAAMTLLVQQSPVHALHHLDGLLNLARKRSRRESQQALEALKDLFVTNLLPSDRKLVPFTRRAPAAGTRIDADTLVFWFFEDALRERYAQLVSALQAHLSDSISHFKASALKTVYELLCEKPEQEAALLSLLVNKLGDPEGKLASKAQYLLLQLVQRHEAMKPVVVREVRQFLIRSNLSTQAQYFATLFLNQLPLHRGQGSLAAELITTYMSLFEACIKRNQLQAKILSAILTGINRGLPYTEGSACQATIETSADSLFTVVHRSTFNTSVQALTLLQQLAQRHQDAAIDASAAAGVGGSVAEDTFVDRFYRALYAKLTLEDLLSSNKHALLLNLIYKACKYDTQPTRVRAFVKRLVQVACHMPAAFAAGTIMLVAEVMRMRPAATTTLVTTPEHVLRDTTRNGTTSGNPETTDVVTVKRADGGRGSDDESDDSDVEEADVALVAPTPDERARAFQLLDAIVGAGEEETSGGAAALPIQPAVVSFDATESNGEAANAALLKYDAMKRDPKYAGAEYACLWELAPLAMHYHPSVRKFADAVLCAPGQGLNYPGDPLADFTIMAFLDRYVYKNPKQKALKAAEAKAAGGDREPQTLEDELAMGYAIVQGQDVDALKNTMKGLVHGASAMQKRASRHGRVDTEAPATSKEFLMRDVDSVAVEDVFMHTYFRTRAAQDELHGRKRGKNADSEVAAVVGAEEEEEDRFADQLAEDLLRGAVGEDADMDDMPDWAEDGEALSDAEEDEEAVAAASDEERDEEAEGSGDDDAFEDAPWSDAGDEEEEEEEAARSRPGARAGTFTVEDDSEDEDLDVGDLLEDEDGVEIEEEIEATPSSGKSKKSAAAAAGAAPSAKKARKGESMFASADDYEDFLQQEGDRYDAAYSSSKAQKSTSSASSASVLQAQAHMAASRSAKRAGFSKAGKPRKAAGGAKKAAAGAGRGRK